MTRIVPVIVVVAAMALAARAQDAAANKPPVLNASVSGIVKDKATGKPLPHYTVSTQVNATWVNNTIFMTAATKDVTSTTDESGRYKLSDLPAGQYRITARDAQRFGSQVSKRVTLSGHDLDGLDFQVVVDGTISGKVVDENKEPVPGMTVLLVSKEYFLGSVGYFLGSSGRTNDRGEYKIARVEAGHPYLLLAEKREMRLLARSDAPLNPKLRRRVPMRTWYLNSPAKEGAAPVTLRPGEDREGVDIEVKKSPSYCAEGVLSTPNGPAALNFSLEAQQPSSGVSSTGGMFMATPNAVTAPDGKFRICDLYPGSYRVLVTQRSSAPNQPPPYFAAAVITISDRDIASLQIAATPGIELDGEVILEGPAPNHPITARVSVPLSPMLRTNLNGENVPSRFDIPGPFSYKGLFIDDYMVRTTLNSPGLYVKDVTYAGRSVMYEPLRLGTAIGNAGVRVIVAQDGATLSARVADKDGNPVPDAQIIVIPADAPSEGVLAARMVSAQTDQTGQYTSHTLPPGKYYVAATAEAFDATEESIGKLWRSKNHFTEVTLPPGGKTQVTLEPTGTL